MAHEVSSRPWFDPRSVYATFEVREVALEQGLLSVVRFPPVSIIPAMLRTHLKTTPVKRTGGQVLGTFTGSKALRISELSKQRSALAMQEGH